MSGERRVSPTEFSALTRRRLLLFLSVDMDGSTRMKQAIAGRQGQAWLGIVLRFLDEFPQVFRAKREELARDQTRPIPDPHVWKMLGDELIFQVEPGRLHDVVAVMETFRAAVETMNERTRSEGRNGGSEGQGIFPLLKGAAWVAGFPVTNAVVRTEGGGEDFVGPSMDTGFRVGRFASPRRLAVSVDLAWLLSHGSARSKLPPLHFEGRVELKGVADESGYPAIWIETPVSGYKRKEDELLGRNAQRTPQMVHELCAAFIREYGVPDHPPFLPGADGDTPLPADYELRCERAIGELRNVYVVDDPDAEPTSEGPQAQREEEELRERLRKPTTE